ncbi:MAG: lytic transglycosylase domain-containing protein, partial [Thermodesulfobacteriota bacterium]
MSAATGPEKASGSPAGQTGRDDSPSQKDMDGDLAQPLEKEVVEPPPASGSFAISALDKEAREALQSKPEISFELDIEETKTLNYYFQYYTQKNHQTFQRWLKRAEPFLPYIRKVFTEKGLPQDLVFLPFAESGFNPLAYSSAGAAGLWQFIPSTARMFDMKVDWWVDERRDPYLSTQAAAEFLSQLYERFDDWYLALAAYNCGGGNISKALKKTEGSTFFDISRTRGYLPRETRNYIPKFLAILKIVRNLESLGFEPITWDAPEVPAKLEVKGGTDLLALARHLDLDWDQFRQANPAFRRMAAPPYKSSPVYLDPSLLAKAETFLKSR